MKILGTSFSLTLGAWRLRLSIDVEDVPDDRAERAYDLPNAKAATLQ